MIGIVERNTAKIYPQGLMAYLPMDSLDPPYNKIGNLTPLVNKCTLVDSAFSFPEVDSSVIFKDSNDFTFADTDGDIPFSLGYYVKFNNIMTTELITKRLKQNDFEWQFDTYQSRFRALVGTPSIQVISRQSASTYVTGQWYFIGITYDGSKSNQGIKIYINGVDDTQPANAATYAGMGNTGSKVFIGKSSYNTTTSLNGSMKKIFWFKDRILTPEEWAYLNTGASVLSL